MENMIILPSEIIFRNNIMDSSSWGEYVSNILWAITLPCGKKLSISCTEKSAEGMSEFSGNSNLPWPDWEPEYVSLCLYLPLHLPKSKSHSRLLLFKDWEKGRGGSSSYRSAIYGNGDQSLAWANFNLKRFGRTLLQLQAVWTFFDRMVRFIVCVTKLKS